MKTVQIYKSLILTLFLIFPFWLSIAYADTKDKKKPVEWLFVITSKEGEITKNNKDQYILTLDHAKIERVLMFSDRPNRIVKYISPKDFKRLWGEGKNSFQKDPPNAIAVFGQDKVAMKLVSITIDKDKTFFGVSSDDDKIRAQKTADVSLLIDSLQVKTFCFDCFGHQWFVFETKQVNGKQKENPH